MAAGATTRLMLLAKVSKAVYVCVCVWGRGAQARPGELPLALSSDSTLAANTYAALIVRIIVLSASDELLQLEARRAVRAAERHRNVEVVFARPEAHLLGLWRCVRIAGGSAGL